MRVMICKKERTLRLIDGEAVLLRAKVALGSCPEGKKTRKGDGRTPEGTYTVCLVKPKGKYGRSLGLSYPNAGDAHAALYEKAIDKETCSAILCAIAAGRRPPWGTALGGEIYIHEGGAQTDWTQGCLALDTGDMNVLYSRHKEITDVVICP